MFPQNVLQSLCSPAPILLTFHRCVCKSLYSHKGSQSLNVYSLYSQKDFPVPMFSKDVPLSLHSPSLNPTVMTPLFHRSVFHSLCSPIMFPISYFPQRYPAVPMLLSPFPCVPQKIIGTGTKLGNIRTDYRDWGTSGIFWEHRDWKHCSVGGHWCWGTKGLREYRDWGA